MVFYSANIKGHQISKEFFWNSITPKMNEILDKILYYKAK